MALEQRVYEELTDIDPKGYFGLTGRQFVAVLLTILVGGSMIAWALLAGYVLSWGKLIIPIAAPFITWAWFKPMGLKFESWLACSWKFWLAPRRRYYSNSPVWEWEYEQEGRKYVLGKKAVKGWTEAGQ